MELYIHIPFCRRKCAYCDFLSFAGCENLQKDYAAALFRDIESRGGILSGRPRVETIYIGGGTPSLMYEGFYEELMRRVRESFDAADTAEISIECNPGTATREKLSEYRRCGINRISFGAQSAKDPELESLGRIHRFADVRETVAMAREAGFDNINIDLMMNLPGQTRDSFLESLQAVIDLNPEHISAYSLILEPGTAFYERYESRPDLLPDEEESCRTYESAVKFLSDCGYRQYEISNFAGEGRECRHNIGYWKREEYLGVGLGAASLIGSRRYAVTGDLSEYLEKCRYASTEELSETDVINETIMLGLRMNEGIGISEFQSRFGRDAAESFSDRMKKYVEAGLAGSSEGRIFLTVKGLLVSNSILSDVMI